MEHERLNRRFIIEVIAGVLAGFAGAYATIIVASIFFYAAPPDVYKPYLTIPLLFPEQMGWRAWAMQFMISVLLLLAVFLFSRRRARVFAVTFLIVSSLLLGATTLLGLVSRGIIREAVKNYDARAVVGEERPVRGDVYEAFFPPVLAEMFHLREFQAKDRSHVLSLMKGQDVALLAARRGIYRASEDDQQIKMFLEQFSPEEFARVKPFYVQEFQRSIGTAAVRRKEKNGVEYMISETPGGKSWGPVYAFFPERNVIIILSCFGSSGLAANADTMERMVEQIIASAR